MQPRYNESTTRRTYPRRKVTFPMSYTAVDGLGRPAFGLNISGGGLCVLTRELVVPPPGRRPGLIASLAGVRVGFEAEIRWQEPVDVRGQRQYRLGLKIARIPDAEWDALMAFSIAAATEGGVTAAVGSILTAQERDSMLPVEKQRRIADRLMALRRLSNPGEGRLPLIEYTFVGYRMLNGVPSYRLRIRSKSVERDGTGTEFHTDVDAAIENSGIVIS